MILDPVLVTGAAGFIGSHTAEALLRRGAPVVGIDNFDPYYDVAIKLRNVQEIETTAEQAGTSFAMAEGDICNHDLIQELLAEHDVQAIIHLAAKAGVPPSLEDPVGYARTNIQGTINLLEAARGAKIARFIFGSSSSVYGDAAQVPFSDLPVLCLRFFTVYGPRQRPDLAINKFVRLLSADESIPKYGDGTSRRDYTYIADIVRGILAALDSDIQWEIINLGSDNPIALNQLIAAVEEVLDKRGTIDQLPLQPGDMRQTHADITKARRLLNWQPRVPLHEGLREFVEWWQST